ncbi:hypothetical protein AWH48_16985 [Domibacillus aminovorans]|uniref:Uncharacterized protein n=1 Tax=Domibacillus aminovorans TaxID=29332 RepID=A0A177KZA3_9BACI|nr:hypothetical protein AWH48_16985 [Domibacillus aminovorans]
MLLRCKDENIQILNEKAFDTGIVKAVSHPRHTYSHFVLHKIISIQKIITVIIVWGIQIIAND